MSNDERGIMIDNDVTSGPFLTLQKKTKENDANRQFYQQQINDIFTLVQSLQETDTIDSPESDPINGDLQDISLNSIKTLAIQLNKLNIFNLKITINSIHVSIEAARKKIDRLKSQCDTLEEKLSSQKHSIENNLSQLNSDYDKLSVKNSQDLHLLNSYNIININNQVNKLQVANFDLLKEIVFSRDRYHNLLIYRHPILSINEFLTYDIIDINQFMEALIKFQIHLADLLKIDLPYLKDLSNCLPNAPFYDLIKQKEILMFKKEPEPEPESDANDPQYVKPEDESPVDKIVKSGNIYKVPLSAKTRNWQRRISMAQSPDPDTQTGKERSLSPTDMSGSKYVSQSNGSAANKTTTNAKDTKVDDNYDTNASITANVNKKMILIPHKILNKPFNKLSIKEFLNFLIVIVKTIVNFEIILVLIGEYDHNDAKKNDLDFDFICNFEKVLETINKFTFKGKICQSLLDLRLKLKDLTENVYKLIIHGDYKSLKSPTILQDLNFRDIIENQTKKTHVGDWDMVSKMF